MQRNLLLLSVTCAIFILAAGMQSYGQNTSPGKKKTAQIKVVTIRDGHKNVLDTVITGENLKVFTHTGGKNLVLVTSDDSLNVDSLAEDFNLFQGAEKEKKIIIMRKGKDEEPIIIRELETKCDSGKKVFVRVEKISPEGRDTLRRRPGSGRQGRLSLAPLLPPGIPLPPEQAFRIQSNPNIINLADPGIISYKKKKLSGGREKITVIRNEVKQTDEETLYLQMDNSGELKKMNAPKVVRELDIQKKDLGHPINK